MTFIPGIGDVPTMPRPPPPTIVSAWAAGPANPPSINPLAELVSQDDLQYAQLGWRPSNRTDSGMWTKQQANEDFASTRSQAISHVLDSVRVNEERDYFTLRRDLENNQRRLCLQQQTMLEEAQSKMAERMDKVEKEAQEQMTDALSKVPYPSLSTTATVPVLVGRVISPPWPWVSLVDLHAK